MRIREMLTPAVSPMGDAHPMPDYLTPYAHLGVSFIPVPVFSAAAPNVKVLMAHNMLQRAYEAGELKGVHTLVEASSGNTLTGLATFATEYGISRLVGVVERDTAPGKLEQLRLSGVEALIPDPVRGLSTVEEARHLGKQDGWLNLDQYSNFANVEYHERHTGPHVWEQTHGMISVLAVGLGTTGTAIGVSKFLRSRSSTVKIVGVAVAPGSAIPGVRTEEKLKQISFDWRSAIDFLALVETKPAYLRSLQLIRSGRAYGPSSGFAFAGGVQFIERMILEGRLEEFRNKDGRIVVAFPCGDFYYSYADKYSTLLDSSDFDPLDPSLVV